MKSDDHFRKYPPFPRIGVGVVVMQDDNVLLAKRGQEPAKGLWTVPGGLIHLGETAEEAAMREVKEECNIDIDILDQIDYYEFIDRDRTDIRYHYIVLEFLALYKSGKLRPQSDVDACQWYKRKALSSLFLTKETESLIRKAYMEINYY